MIDLDINFIFFLYVTPPEPVSFTDVGMATDGVILVSNPHNQDDVECRRRVVKKLGHYSLHSYNIFNSTIKSNSCYKHTLSHM